MLKLLLVFVLLQLADLATTLTVLALGGTEGNPLVLKLMSLGSTEGLVLAKTLALAIGAFCYFASKRHALRIANIAFTAIVAWNATVILILL